MFFSLFKNYIKSLTRNIGFDLSLILRIFSILSIVYICFFAIYLGLNLEMVLGLLSLNLNPVGGVNSILFCLFFTGMLLLYFFQSDHSDEIISYLHLPIKRNKIVSYILIRSFLNFFNLGFILFFIAFSFTSVFPLYARQNFILYLTGVFLIMIFVSFLALLLRNIVKIRYIFVIIPYGLVLVVVILEAIFHSSVESFSKLFFQSLLNGNYILISLIFFSLLALLVAIVVFFRNAIYRVSAFDIKSAVTLVRLVPTYLRNRYIMYLLLELKLIGRNKRIFNFFIIAVGFLFLFYYELLNREYGLFFSFAMYIFLTGIFGYIFSQYLFSWESSYFDCLFSKSFDLLKYLKSKYIIYVFLGFLVFILFLPLVIQKKIDLHLFITALLFNSFIGYFVLFYLATFNCSRIDLNRNIFLNLQGWNSTQMLALIIIIFSPLVLLFALLFIFSVTQSLLIINFLSIISLLYWESWFKTILNKLLKRKYINLEGYRK